jgi:hypothetical protein
MNPGEIPCQYQRLSDLTHTPRSIPRLERLLVYRLPNTEKQPVSRNFLFYKSATFYPF